MIGYLNYNGEIVSASQPLVSVDNRGFRYGDGLFETMKMDSGDIQFVKWHFERLFEGMQLLAFEKPSWLTQDFLSDAIRQLAVKNHLEKCCRVRLMVFRGGGGIFDPENHTPNFVIEVFALPDKKPAFPGQGLVIDVFPDARKAADRFSHLKTNNYLPYLMAAIYAKKHRLHDALLLNTDGNLCDAVIANLFIVANEKIITPPLTSGCVAGILRRYLLEQLPLAGFTVIEQDIAPVDLLHCEEIFLTNSISPIRWVKQCGADTFCHTTAKNIFHALAAQFR